jgi:simple sugar transport system permease protein
MPLPLRIDTTGKPGPVRRALVPVLAVLAGVFLAGALVELSGHSAAETFDAMITGAVGSPSAIAATLLRATPLILTGLAVSLALRLQLWNIGGEGQLLIGAAVAAGVGFTLPDLSGWVLIPLMFLAGCLGGALWAQIAAIPRARMGLSEIIVTLFLNYIAIRLVSLLVLGPWKDPGAIGFAYTKPVPEQSRLGSIPGTTVSVGLVVALVVVLVAWWVFNRTAWGFSVDVVGGNEKASVYLRLRSRTLILSVFAVSGAVAGLAGAIQLMGQTGRLQPDLASGYGYAGILVAFLAGRSIIGIVGSAAVFAALIQGGFALQSTGVPSALSTVIQALVILFAIVGRATAGYRIRRVEGAPATAPASVEEMA